jgi:hypothetical protein
MLEYAMYALHSREKGNMEPSVADAIRSFAARNYVDPARRKGSELVEIRVGDVHKALKLRNRVPNVSSALRSRIFLEQNGLKLEKESGPPSGMGTRTTFKYRLLEKRESRPTSREDPDFEKLRGLLKEALAELGGGEAFLRRERHHFYESDAELPK